MASAPPRPQSRISDALPRVLVASFVSTPWIAKSLGAGPSASKIPTAMAKGRDNRGREDKKKKKPKKDKLAAAADMSFRHHAVSATPPAPPPPPPTTES